MRFSTEDNRIYLSVSELARYAFQRENPRLLAQKLGFRLVQNDAELDGNTFTVQENREELPASEREHGVLLHSVLETDARAVEGSQTEVPLSRDLVCGAYRLTVQGYADIISFDGSLHTVEEIKTIRSAVQNPLSDPAHFAQAAVYAALYAEREALPKLIVRLTFVRRSDSSRASYEAEFTRVALERMLDALISRASPFLVTYAERFTVFRSEAEALPFPYPKIREGQAQFIQAAYRSIRAGKNLLVNAPTGIGKTISVLYPAVKALGEGRIDRIFYFTAKNITGQAAMETAARLSAHAPHLRTVMVLSKDNLCPYRNGDAPRPQCRSCELMSGVTEDFGLTYRSFRERELDALAELIADEDRVYTADRLLKTAQRYKVCPHELSLDLSELCMIIVCDYNYVLDDRSRFRRYFKNPENEERYVFLFDEAHNLPDRVRDAYSASLPFDFLEGLGALAENELCDELSFRAKLKDFADALGEVADLCDENEYAITDRDGEKSGAFGTSAFTPPRLLRACADLSRELSPIMNDDPELELKLKPYDEILKQFAYAGGYSDERFRFFAHRENGRVLCELLCLDPSGLIGRMLSPGVCSVLFSATLSPIDYFREVTGMESASVLELDSPYERDNLCLVAYDGLSTRFSDRRNTASDCAELILTVVSGREGHYIAYFPSYDYMKRVCRAFVSAAPDVALVMQKPGMSRKERERFIRVFREKRDCTVVGFCVLGGMFSEGIDLQGESLIGAIVFGTGMPQLSAERNLMSAYYEEKTERGFDFAYVCPGMNKVQQAAGRVIRSESDRGVIVLADDRLGNPNMRALFPKHWRHMRFTADLDSLAYLLEDFWSSQDRS